MAMIPGRRWIGGAAALVAAAAGAWALSRYLNAPEEEDSRPEGWWEDGDRFYLEVRGSRMTLRDFSKQVLLSAEQQILDRGSGHWEIVPEETAFTLVDGSEAEVMALCWDGEGLQFRYRCGDGVECRTLVKAVEGPFADTLIRDEELLPQLQGRWVQEDGDYVLCLADDILTITHGEETVSVTPVHTVSYRHDESGHVYLVNAELTENYIGDFPGFEMKDGALVSYLEAWDEDRWPTVRFVRAE